MYYFLVEYFNSLPLNYFSGNSNRKNLYIIDFSFIYTLLMLLLLFNNIVLTCLHIIYCSIITRAYRQHIRVLKRYRRKMV